MFVKNVFNVNSDLQLSGLPAKPNDSRQLTIGYWTWNFATYENLTCYKKDNKNEFLFTLLLSNIKETIYKDLFCRLQI